MRHRVKKIKFRRGKDANKMLLRKLTTNFIKKGKITTTKAKAKALKSFLEKIVNKSKQESEANKNYLLKRLGNKQVVKILFKEIGLAVKNKTSGYFKQTTLGQRLSDGSTMVKLYWAVPVVLEENKKINKSKIEQKTGKDEKKKLS